LSRHQRSILADAFRGLPPDAAVVLAFDADAGGDRLAREVADLAQGVRVVRELPPHGKDWNECVQRSEREYIASLSRLQPRGPRGLG
jgi:DNA primase